MPELNLKIANLNVKVDADRPGEPFDAVAYDWSNMAVSKENSSVDISIKLYIRNWSEPSPLKLPSDAKLLRFGGRKVFSHADSKRYFIDFHENAFFVIEDNYAEGVLYIYPNLDPLFWTELSINQILLLLLKRKGIDFLHAGGAVDSKNNGIFFCGTAGTGKSSAALALASHGFGFMGDDILLFDSKRFYAFPKIPSASDWTVNKLSLNAIGERKNGKKLIKVQRISWSTDSFSIFQPVPSSNNKNEIREMNKDDAFELIESQSKFCVTDEIIAGRKLNPELLSGKCNEVSIGDLSSLHKLFEPGS